MVTYFTEEHRKKAYETRMRNKELKKQQAQPQVQTPQVEVKAQLPTNIDLERKRIELESRRLDAEIAKFGKPDTSIDYYAKMLELQANHTKQLLEMQQQNFNTQLEIERLKNGLPAEESEFDFESIKSMLPLIAEGMKKHNNQAQQGKQGSISPLPVAPVEPKKEVKPMISDGETLESYKQKIKDGLITEEQAWKDFQEQVPPVVVKQMGYEGFKAHFDKIKNGLE